MSKYTNVCLTGPCCLRNELQEFAFEMERILSLHDESKGESWRTCTIGFLEGKLHEELSEYASSPCRSGKCDELVDIANICMMLYHRRLK